MSYQNYSLEVISKHNQFKDKSLCKYHIDGIDTVGVWGNEPFEIKFKNHTYNKIQVKITLDGTDVLTGVPGTTEVSEKMWVVNPYESMILKAWPETHNGGAGFVFTDTSNSVAAHTHGNLSAKGIIAAAVYIEGHVEYPKYNPFPTVIWGGGYNYGGCGDLGGIAGSGVYYNTTVALNNSTTSSIQSKNTQSLIKKEAAAVGAGDFVEQKVSYVSGLIKPVFTESIRIRYLWWSDLEEKLNKHYESISHPSGFPNDPPLINLKSVPRITTKFKNYNRFCE